MSKYGKHIRRRDWKMPDLPWTRIVVAAVTALALVASLLAYQQARRDLSDADRRITALEWGQRRDRGLIDELRVQLAVQGAWADPGPGVTWYQTPEPERTLPPAQPNRSRPRRTLLPTPMPAPSWHPVTPHTRPDAQAKPPPSPTPTPTPAPSESPNACPAATVGDALRCVIASVSASPSPSVP